MGDKRERNSDWEVFHEEKSFRVDGVWVAFLLLAVSIGAQAQNPTPNPTQFSGVIDAYSPQTGTTGPYEVHGPWSLQLSSNPQVRRLLLRP